MKVGVLGGTFDPIHLGHLCLARAVEQALELDRVLFMVARDPPHKRDQRPSFSYHRYAMVVLGTLEEDRFLPSTWELEQDGPSFTIDTLEHLGRVAPRDQICFIAGSDSLWEIHTWKDCDKLLGQHCFIFVQRQGRQVRLEELKIGDELRGTIHRTARGAGLEVAPGRSWLVEFDVPEVSSSQIRRDLAAGRDPSPGFLPPAVLRYAREHRLYEKHPPCS